MDINLVTTLTKFLQSLLRVENKINLNQPLDELRMALNRIFAFSYVWALGGNIREESLEEFSEHAREKLAVLVNFPPAGLVFDFKLSIQEPAGGTGVTIVDIVSWQQSIPEYKYNPATPYFEILVPTIDTVSRRAEVFLFWVGARLEEEEREKKKARASSEDNHRCFQIKSNSHHASLK